MWDGQEATRPEQIPAKRSRLRRLRKVLRECSGLEVTAFSEVTIKPEPSLFRLRQAMFPQLLNRDAGTNRCQRRNRKGKSHL